MAVIDLPIDCAALFILGTPLWLGAAYLSTLRKRSFSLLWLFGLVTVDAIGLGISAAVFWLLESNGFEII